MTFVRDYMRTENGLLHHEPERKEREKAERREDERRERTEERLKERERG